MALVGRLDVYPQRVEADSGPMTGGPSKLVLHSTEGDTFAGAASVLSRNGNWPHVLASPHERQIAQGVDLNHAAKALMNLGGGVETNRDAAIQIEIVGRAAFMHLIDRGELRWLAEQLRPLFFVCGIEIAHHVTWVNQDDGFIARADAPQRLSFPAWDAYNAVCGHQHVPENDHWDPGKFPIVEFLEMVRGAPLEPVVAVDFAAILDEIERNKGVPVNTFTYKSQTHAITVEDDGTIAHHYQDAGSSAWGTEYLAGPRAKKTASIVRVATVPARAGGAVAVTLGSQNNPDRIDVCVDQADGRGIVHCWFGKAGKWGSEVVGG